jgi:hypothetical protein
LLDDEPRLGGQPIDFLDIQILSFFEKQHFHSAYDDFEPFTRLAWNGIVPFTLDAQSVDAATSRQQDSEMSGVATIARKDGGK